MIYDLIIIGAGPAGLAASIYASRFKIKHVVIGKLLGGMAAEAHLVDNYPGYQSLTGQELMIKFLEHSRSYETKILEEEVIDIHQREGNKYIIELGNKERVETKSLIFAPGTAHRRLGIPGEKEYWARGVASCVTCDAPLYKNKTVAVVGGGNSALTSALLLAEYAKQIYLIHRRQEYSAHPNWQEKVKNQSKIVKIFETNVEEIKGDKVVREIILDQDYQGQKNLKVDGVFIKIGLIPLSNLTKKLGVELDEKGYIKVNRDCQTNISGVMAAGDATNFTSLKQILTAASQGAIAAVAAYKYLNKS